MASVKLHTSMVKKKFISTDRKTDKIKWIKNGRVITYSYSLHSGILVSPDPFVMKSNNNNNNLAASDFCLMDSISLEIMSCFIRTIVKYKDDLFVILQKHPFSCWIVNNKKPHARIQILFPGGPKDIYVFPTAPGGRGPRPIFDSITVYF